MASARFLTLSQRIRKLRNRLIPKKFSPTGQYTERQRDLARAYRLLVHAEIESYLEDRARTIALKAVALFKADEKPRRVIANLIGFHCKSRNMDEEKLIELYGRGQNHLFDAVDLAMNAYVYMLNNNHGVRQFNVLRILLPLGFRVSEITPTLVATLDSFGANRGEVAHTSIKTQQQIDPKADFETVEMILKDLVAIDDQFTRLWRTC